jgi:hypothetical protein
MGILGPNRKIVPVVSENASYLLFPNISMPAAQTEVTATALTEYLV